MAGSMTTVNSLIAMLKEFDPEAQVVFAYDGRYAHSTDFGVSALHGSDLFQWRGEPNDVIVVIEA
jgi:hypothetical protein